MKKSKFLIFLSLLILISMPLDSWAEKLEPIENPKIYKKFDIEEGISKSKFKSRLKEQEKILKELEERVDRQQYLKFLKQHEKNKDYFEENYKGVFTKVNEGIRLVVTKVLTFVGVIFLLYGMKKLFCYGMGINFGPSPFEKKIEKRRNPDSEEKTRRGEDPLKRR